MDVRSKCAIEWRLNSHVMEPDNRQMEVVPYRIAKLLIQGNIGEPFYGVCEFWLIDIDTVASGGRFVNWMAMNREISCGQMMR